MDRQPVLIPFGILFLGVGLGIGYLMFATPEGLNPDWPIWMALLVPAAFMLAGLHIVAQGLGYPRLSGLMVGVIAVCLLAIVNWAAFFTTSVECAQTISFLDFALLRRYPSEAECRASLRVIIAGIDLLVAVPLLAFAWRKRRKS